MTAGDEKVNFLGGNTMSFPDGLIGKIALINVDTFAESVAGPNEVVESPFVADLDEYGGNYIAEGIAGRTTHSGGDIGHAVVDHLVFHEHGIFMVGHFRGLEAPPLVDTHIDYQGFGAHGKSAE